MASLSYAQKRATPMPIIDSQVHVYEANTPERPWHSVQNWPDHVTGKEMGAAMDAVGVDGAIFISVFSLPRSDRSRTLRQMQSEVGTRTIATSATGQLEESADGWRYTHSFPRS